MQISRANESPSISVVVVLVMLMMMLVSSLSSSSSATATATATNKQASTTSDATISSDSTTPTSMMPTSMPPRYAEIVMQAQCQANCLAKVGELAYSSDVTLLPVYSCTTDKCRQCSAPCDTDIINLVSPQNCKASKCSSFDKLCHDSCNLRFHLKQANIETNSLPMAPNPFGLQVSPPEVLCIDDPATAQQTNPVQMTMMMMSPFSNNNNNYDNYENGQRSSSSSTNHRNQPRVGGKNNGSGGGGKSLTLRWLARYLANSASSSSSSSSSSTLLSSTFGNNSNNNETSSLPAISNKMNGIDDSRNNNNNNNNTTANDGDIDNDDQEQDLLLLALLNRSSHENRQNSGDSSSSSSLNNNNYKQQQSAAASAVTSSKHRAPIVSVVTMRRNNSKKIRIIGKIVGQVITLTNLSPKSGYIFEVTSVSPDGIIQPAVASSTIFLGSASASSMAESSSSSSRSDYSYDSDDNNLPPTAAGRFSLLRPPVAAKFVTEFFYHHNHQHQHNPTTATDSSDDDDDQHHRTSASATSDDSSGSGGIGVYVHWKPDPATYSCYYEVFVLKTDSLSPTDADSASSSGVGYVSIRARTKETHNVLRIDNMKFDSNYTIRIFSTDRLFTYQSNESLDIAFQTPSCIQATNRNYSVCGPEPPTNATGHFLCTNITTTTTTTTSNDTTMMTANGDVGNSSTMNTSSSSLPSYADHGPSSSSSSSVLSLIVNWTSTLPDISKSSHADDVAAAFSDGFQVDIANDPIPELILTVDQPSDWQSFYVEPNKTWLLVDNVLPNQIYFVQIRTIFGSKKSQPLVLRLESPGSRSSICFSDHQGGQLDYAEDASILIANWTVDQRRSSNLLFHAARRGSSASVDDEEGMPLVVAGYSLLALSLIATIIIAAAVYWLRKARHIKQAKHVVDTVAMKCSTLYEVTTVINQKFDRFEVTWTQLSLLPHVLGEGAFGKVIHGQLLAPELTGSEGAADVAVKMLRDNATDEERLSLLSEIETMKRVRQVCGEHPNVVSLLACVTRNGLCSQPALVMDLCPFGSLRDYLRQLRGKGPREIANLCGKGATLFKMAHNYPTMRMTTINQQQSADSGVTFGCNSDHHQNQLTSSAATTTAISTAERLLLLSLENQQQQQQQQQQLHPPALAASSSLAAGGGVKSSSCSTTCTVDVGPDQNPPLFMLLLSFASQICAGMEHLAVHKFVHRDLATRNVLVYDFDQIKISDFGLSRDIYEDAKYQKTTAGRLPIKWMAPEAIIDQMYTTASDVWSFGIVLWELLTLGATPYCLVLNQDLPRLLRGGYRLERPDNCPEDLYAIMSACWALQAEQRPTFTALVEQVESLQSKTERTLASSVYEVEDYVTATGVKSCSYRLTAASAAAAAAAAVTSTAANGYDLHGAVAAQMMMTTTTATTSSNYVDNCFEEDEGCGDADNYQSSTGINKKMNNNDDADAAADDDVYDDDNDVTKMSGCKKPLLVSRRHVVGNTNANVNDACVVSLLQPPSSVKCTRKVVKQAAAAAAAAVGEFQQQQQVVSSKLSTTAGDCYSIAAIPAIV